jgi:single-strand DNA-binding protein
MAGMCKVTVIGNLGRDPEKRYTQDGKPMTRFSVAATTRRQRNGEWQDHTEWFNVTVFGRQAETLSERLTKGSRIYVDGRLESRTYESPNSGKGFAMDIVANEIIQLDTRQRGEGEFGGGDNDENAPAQERVAARSSAADTDEAQDLEDLPF